MKVQSFDQVWVGLSCGANITTKCFMLKMIVLHLVFLQNKKKFLNIYCGVFFSLKLSECPLLTGNFQGNCSRGTKKQCPLQQVSAIKVSAIQRYFYESLTRIRQVPKKVSAITRCPLYSMSAIDRFDCIFFIRYVTGTKYIKNRKF